MAHESNPSKYSNFVEMLKKEVNEGNARKGASCCKAFVWLTRLYALLKNGLGSQLSICM